MNKKIVSRLIWLLILISSTQVLSQKSNEQILFNIADKILESGKFELLDAENEKTYLSVSDCDSTTKLSIASPYNDWRYWNGVINIALLKLGKENKKEKYQMYVENSIAFGFDSYQHFEKQHVDENKWSYPLGQFFIMEELDDCGAMGASIIELYKDVPQPRYKEYLEKSAKHISEIQQRLDDGTLVRAFPKEWTLWADDLYMGISFLARYGELTGENSYFDDATTQVINFNKYLFDDKAGVMYHNYYSDEQKQGIAFWGRANGWAMVAQADLLERLSADYENRGTLLKLYKRHIDGVIKYQSKSGLWHQLLDKPDSYLETSCSAMFTYVIAKGINMGILDSAYIPIAKLGWEGVISKITKDGLVEGVCAGTIVYDELQPYYDRPTPLNDIHGIGAVLLAGIEIEKLNGCNDE